MVKFDKDIIEDPHEDLDNVKVPSATREGPIIDLLNTRLLDQNDTSYHQTDPKSGHLSSVDGCNRKTYLNYVHKLDDKLQPPKESIGSYWTFLHGDLIHEEIQEMFVECLGPEHVTVEETLRPKISDSYSIWGHADLVIRDLDAFPDPFVIDIKTKSEFKYYNYSKSGHVRSIPQEKHIKQLTGYMHHIGADIGALLYYSKRNDHLEEYWVEYDPELYEEIEDQLIEVLDDVNTGRMSDKTAKSYLCDPDFCKYYREGLCDGVDDASTPDNYDAEKSDFNYEDPQWG